jgi:hypothetical protein
MPEQSSREQTGGAGWPAKSGMVLAVIAWASFTALDFYGRNAPCLLGSWGTALVALIVLSFLAAGVLTMGSLIAGLLTQQVRVIALTSLTGFMLFIEFASFVNLRREGTATDSAAVATIRTLTTAEIMYSSQTSKYGSIEDLLRLGLIDTGFRGTKLGYQFTVVTGESDYTIKGTSVSNYGCLGLLQLTR